MTTQSRHIPLRTCVICGSKTGKRELIRIVATPEGRVVIDPTGKKNGRGAYSCRDRNCADTEPRRGRLEHALRAKMNDEEWEQIVSYVSALGVPQ